MAATTNRAQIARKNAGLSVNQAAKLLGVLPLELAQVEEFDSHFADADHVKLAEIYGVNVEWLTGEAERYDYDRVSKMRGADRLKPHDRDIIAEFAASMPRRKP